MSNNTETTNIVRQKFIPKYGLCIDWETSGVVFGGDSTVNYQGISFGAAIFDTLTLEEVDSIYVEIKFEEADYQWQDRAEEIHGLSRAHLAANGVTQEEALVMLMELLVKWMGPEPGKILFAGHNPGFDQAFTEQLFAKFGLVFETHLLRLDTSGTAFVAMGIYKSDDVFDTFTGRTRGKHNALDDVRLSLESLRAMRQVFQLALTM